MAQRWGKLRGEGPYIHHCSCCYGHCADVLEEAARYIPSLQFERFGRMNPPRDCWLLVEYRGKSGQGLARLPPLRLPFDTVNFDIRYIRSKTGGV